jgi:hypothetical protein
MWDKAGPKSDPVESGALAFEKVVEVGMHLC